MKSRKSFLLLTFLFALGECANLGANPIVQIKNGKVQGKVQTTFDKGTYYSFQGIPFAKPPLGTLRFQAPTAPADWSGVFQATSDPNECFQVKSDSPTENEDCLHINVFTPIHAINNKTSKLPVMFWIYGGGFRAGSSQFVTTGPDWFVEQDIIVVTFNYRVGPFGFLSTGDLVVPGNAGLKDQQMALKWTHDNIAAFGGDPLKITIAGQSAGSASVGYQLLSPGSTNLFRGAIQESGSPLNPWASIMNPKEYVIDLIKLIDPSNTMTVNTASATLLQYLQGVTARQIDSASTKTAIKLTLPVIEPEHAGAFITQGMYEAFQAGNYNKVPAIVGINSEEQLVMLQSTGNVRVVGRGFDNNLQTLIPLNFKTAANNLKTVASDIKHIYTTNNQKFADYLNDTIRYLSDSGFTKGVIKQGELMSKYSNVYFYVFSHDGQMGGFHKTIDGCGKVSHGEETKYIWTIRGTHSNQDLSKYPQSDQITHQRLVKLWTNFVKDLNPTPQNDALFQNLRWPTVTATNYQYMDIDDNMSIKKTPKSSYPYWVSIYSKYAETPYINF